MYQVEANQIFIFSSKSNPRGPSVCFDLVVECWYGLHSTSRRALFQVVTGSWKHKQCCDTASYILFSRYDSIITSYEMTIIFCYQYNMLPVQRFNGAVHVVWPGDCSHYTSHLTVQSITAAGHLPQKTVERGAQLMQQTSKLSSVIYDNLFSSSFVTTHKGFIAPLLCDLILMQGQSRRHTVGRPASRQASRQVDW